MRPNVTGISLQMRRHVRLSLPAPKADEIKKMDLGAFHQIEDSQAGSAGQGVHMISEYC